MAGQSSALASPGGASESSEVMVEVAELSQTWSLFQQLMLALPPSQPLLLLATAHTTLLPPDLLRFFNHTEDAEGSAQPTVRLDSLPPAAWHDAVERASRSVAHSIAAAIAASAHEHVERLHAAEGAEAQQTAPASEQEPDGGPSKPAAQQEKSQAELLAEEKLHVSLALQQEVQSRIQAMAAGMLQDRRLPTAQCDFVPRRAAAVPVKAPEIVKLQDTVLAAAQGQFRTLTELRRAVHGTANRIRRALQQAAKIFALTPLSSNRFTAGKEFRTKQAAQLSATAVLTDLLDGWCHALTAELGLDQPERFRQLAAAEAHLAKQDAAAAAERAVAAAAAEAVCDAAAAERGPDSPEEVARDPAVERAADADGMHEAAGHKGGTAGKDGAEAARQACDAGDGQPDTTQNTAQHAVENMISTAQQQDASAASVQPSPTKPCDAPQTAARAGPSSGAGPGSEPAASTGTPRQRRREPWLLQFATRLEADLQGHVCQEMEQWLSSGNERTLEAVEGRLTQVLNASRTAGQDAVARLLDEATDMEADMPVAHLVHIVMNAVQQSMT